MKRSFFVAAATTTLFAAASAPLASARIVEVGSASPLVAPVCPRGVKPTNCTIVLTQVTALETIGDGAAYPTTITQPGQIVGFTVGLSALSSNRTTRKTYIRGLDHQYGGTAQAAITVLAPTGPKASRRFTVLAESAVYHLQPFLGEVVQFPLATTLTVKPGDVIALTSPTWAPVLSIQLPAKQFAYRQSRTANCGKPAATEQAQLTIGASARYLCNYPGTRVEYSATEVLMPRKPRNYVHARRRAA